MSFVVTVLPSGRSFECDADEPLLSAAMRAGVGLPYGCKDGACGSCKCKLVSGDVALGAHQGTALSEAEEAAGFTLACQARPRSAITLESRVVVGLGEFPIRKLPSRVNAIEQVAPDVKVLKLQLPGGDPLRYHAGQYMEIILRDGARRSYSMGNAPHNGPGVEFHIRHTPGGKFTDHVFGPMKEREVLRMEGPYGSFFLREDSDKPMILLASGTGFAPIKALIEHVRFKRITRPAVLYWGGRRLHDLYMDAWVKACVAEMPTLSYVPVISDAPPEDGWHGRDGFVHRAVMADFPDMSGHQVYACGAPIVIDSARAEFIAQCKLPEDEFYADSFITEADKARAAA